MVLNDSGDLLWLADQAIAEPEPAGSGRLRLRCQFAAPLEGPVRARLMGAGGHRLMELEPLVGWIMAWCIWFAARASVRPSTRRR